MEQIRIEHDSLFDNFKEHILLPQNNRILFTAPFGTGKTTFLKEFFDNNVDRYITIDLYPIQYSVSQNEDVFELIKFDILLQLIGKYEDKLNLQKEDFFLLLTSQVYIQEHLNIMPLVNTLLSMSEKVGKPAVALIKALLDVVGDFKKFQDEIKIDEKSEIERILRILENKKGSAYEMDAVSDLICGLVQRVKDYEDKSKKETVLIIDDLDRLDPDHIFRLFNVFSSQFNVQDDGNKFEFDKIIFVCDIENIWKIYRHKYGSGVDFQGYIDKFYSLNAFNFDNREFVRRKVGELLRSFNFSSSMSGRIFNILIKERESSELYHVVRWIFLSLIDSKNINLRNLINPPATIVIPEFLIDFNSKNLSSFSSNEFHIIGVFHMLKAFYGSFEMVKEKLNDLKDHYGKDKVQKSHPSESFNNVTINSYKFSMCIPFLLPLGAIKQFRDKKLDNETMYSDDLKCWINYSIEDKNTRYSDYEFKFKRFMDSEEGETGIQLDPYEVLYITFENCLKNGYLNE